MLTRLRDVLYRAVVMPHGDSFAPIRVSKDLARRLNATLGQPLASTDELVRRADAANRLRRLRAVGSNTSRSSAAGPPPVLVYFEAGRNVRELTRIEELLGSRAIAWNRLDVAADEATLEFVMRRVGCERDELPVVFVADRAIGTYQALVDADVSGELKRLTTSGTA